MISVIIPTLNEEDHIGHLLEFLRPYDEQGSIEIIVVDGGSVDKTVEEVQAHKAVQLIKTEQASRAIQMNAGARIAKGELLYFVHADTQLVPDFVKDIHAAISNGYESGCYRFKFCNPKNPLLHINGFFTRFPFKWCRGGDQTLFIRKTVFDEIKGFDEHFTIMEDYDILDRLEQKDVAFKVIPKSVKVSTRKYHRNSYLKVQLANLRAMKMYKKGVEPDKIKAFYMDSLYT